MSDTIFVREALRSTYTIERFGSVKAAQIAAYIFLRELVTGHELTLRRVRAMFEGKANIIRGTEKDAVRTARIEEARNERIALRARLDRLDALLAAVGEEFSGPHVEAIREQASGGGAGRPLDGGDTPRRSAPAGSSSGLD